MLRLKHYSVIHFFFIVIEFKYLYLKDTIVSPGLKEGQFNRRIDENVFFSSYFFIGKKHFVNPLNVIGNSLATMQL